VVDARGYHRLGDDDVAAVVTSVVEGRNQRPDGPQAPLH
jgi:proteasome beta subunit